MAPLVAVPALAASALAALALARGSALGCAAAAPDLNASGAAGFSSLPGWEASGGLTTVALRSSVACGRPVRGLLARVFPGSSLLLFMAETKPR